MGFGAEIVLFARQLPRNREGWHIADQLIRAGTAVGANYRASRRARSRKEFVAKLGIVIEECDETLFWLELMGRLQIADPGHRERLAKEANELCAIFVVTRARVRRSAGPP